jgi:triphosphatase
MSEIELKFQIPVTHKKALLAAVAKQQCTPMHLVAKYYDTPEHSLAQHKISLRQRLENKVWKQTLKAPSEHAIQRFELDLTLKKQPKYINLDLYQDYPQIQKKLKRVLKDSQPLALQFSTDVQRQTFDIIQSKSCIEVALDQGLLKTKQQHTKISEIEFELKHGSIQDLLKAIQPWIQEYGIYLDIQTKAERGYALDAGFSEGATYQTDFYLDQNISSDHALRKMVNHCLLHLLPNASAIARGHYIPEHIHQTRVAIRRLRTAFKTFAKWTKTDLSHYQNALKTLFQHLSSTRDQDALAESLIPALKSIGSPITVLPYHQHDPIDLIALFRAAETNLLWLSLIEFSQIQQIKPQKCNLKNMAKQRIVQLHQQIIAPHEDFLNLADEEKHRIRKKVKQLRYSVEFSRSLFNPQQVKSYLKALKPLQEVLGQFNDLVVAEQLIRPAIKKQAKYWFVLGWLKSQQQHILQQAHAALQHFYQHGRF